METLRAKVKKLKSWLKENQEKIGKSGKPRKSNLTDTGWRFYTMLLEGGSTRRRSVRSHVLEVDPRFDLRSPNSRANVSTSAFCIPPSCILRFRTHCKSNLLARTIIAEKSGKLL